MIFLFFVFKSTRLEWGFLLLAEHFAAVLLVLFPLVFHIFFQQTKYKFCNIENLLRYVI